MQYAATDCEQDTYKILTSIIFTYPACVALPWFDRNSGRSGSTNSHEPLMPGLLRAHCLIRWFIVAMAIE